jgi:hypothetical protein
MDSLVIAQAQRERVHNLTRRWDSGGYHQRLAESRVVAVALRATGSRSTL